MAKQRESYHKDEIEKNKEKKRLEKLRRREERKANSKSASFEDMLAYVDEDGNITTTPPDPTKKKVVRHEDIEIGARKQSDEPVERTRRGRITFFNTSKGYGFIKDSDTQESIFVHINSTLDPIKENDKVTFEVEMGPKGPNAVRVKVVG